MPNDERDDDSGQFASKYTDDDFLDALADLDGAATSSEVADAVGCPKRTAQHRLGKLRDEGRVGVREVGGAYLWLLEDDPPDAGGGGGDDGGQRAGRETPSAPGDETDDRSPTDAPGHDAGPSTTPRETRDTEGGDAGADPDGGDGGWSPNDERVRAVVDAIAAGTVDLDSDFIGWDDDDRLEDRKAAARAVLAHALETGDHISRSDAVDGFREQFPVDGQSADTWWRRNARVVLRAVGDHRRGAGYRVDPEQVAAVAGTGDDR